MTRRLPFVLNRSSRSNRRPKVAGTLAGVIALALAGTACSPVEPAGSDGGEATQSAGGQDVFGDPADAAQVKQGGTLTVALSADPDKLDPSLSRSLYSRYVFHTMCEKLYDLGPDAKIVPQLATALPKVS